MCLMQSGAKDNKLIRIPKWLCVGLVLISPKDGKSTLTHNVKCWLLISVRPFLSLAFILCTRIASPSLATYLDFIKIFSLFQKYSYVCKISFKNFFLKYLLALSGFSSKSLDMTNC